MINRKAFTLIELLVVIAIVGVLSGFIFVSMTGAINSAKDAKRKADLAAIENAILIYKTNNNGLPSSDTNCNICNGCSGACSNLYANLQQYLPLIPTDPNSGIFYKYNAVSADNYTLQSNLSNGDIYGYDSTAGAWVTLSAVQATPTFNPVGGTVASGTTVTIVSAGADAIYYTTDGSDPTISSTNQAITPLVINSPVTVKALAIKAGYANSAIGTASYAMFAYGQYKKTITILNNPSSSAISGIYPVKLNVNTAALVTAGKMRNDCNDLRFSDNPVTTNLSYWIESGCNTASTIVWVKLPNGIPATTGTTINMYYGTQTVSVANGDTTFSFFDHFDTALDTVNKWTVTTGSFAISNSIISNNAGTTNSEIATKYPNISLGTWAFKSRAAMAQTSVQSAWMGTVFNGVFTMSRNAANNYGYCSYNCSWGGPTRGDFGTGYTGYHLIEGLKKASSFATIIDGTQLVDNAGNICLSDTNWRFNGGYNYGNNAISLDWVLVRPYNTAEPTGGTITFGAEGVGQ